MKLLLISLISSGLFAQSNSIILTGKLTVSTGYKYAFLYDETTKVRYIQPINEGKFQFAFEKPSFLENKIVDIYLGRDSLRTFEDARRRYAFVDADTRRIALEDSVHIEISSSMEGAVVSGGTLNRDLTDMQSAIKTRKYNDYFSSHSNSIISVLFLRALFILRTNELFVKNSEPLDYKAIYASLSNSVKNTESGKKLGKLINGESLR